METPFIIRLTHLQTMKPTYVKVNDITSVRENTEGKTLVLTGNSGQYVAETVDQVITTLQSVGFEVC